MSNKVVHAIVTERLQKLKDQLDFEHQSLARAQTTVQNAMAALTVTVGDVAELEEWLAANPVEVVS